MSNIVYLDEKKHLGLKIKLHKFCKNYDNKKLKIIDNKGNVFKSRFLFFYNFVINKAFQIDPLRNILLEYFSKCESFYPGSSFLFAKLISGFSSFDMKKNKFSKNYKTFEKYIKTVSEYGPEFLELIKFAGPEASIKLETTNATNISVFKRSSSRFYFSNNNLTASIFFKNKNKVKRTVRCVVIDGYLEREKEIFQLLEKSFIEKKTPVIFCRGLSTNLLNFINSFITKNRFPVLIYDNKFSHDDPFSFLDFAKINNSLPVSIDTGDDVRYDCYEKSFIIENCILTRDYIEFNPDKKFSKDLLKEIDEQKNMCHDDESKKYIANRKKRCGINIVEIYLPKLQKRKIQEFKFLIHCYNSIAKFGMIENDGIIYGRQEIDVVNKLYEKFNSIINNTSIILELKKEDKDAS